MEWSPDIIHIGAFTLNLGTAALIVALTFCGALIQGTMGFGFAVVTAPFLYAINPAFVPIPLIITFLPLSSVMISKYREGLNKSITSTLIIGRIPGTFLGAFLLTVASHQSLSLMLGTMVLASVMLSITKLSIRANHGSLLVAGFASGVTATAASIGGPPLAIVMQNESGTSVRANLACVNMICNIVSLVILYFYGQLKLEHFILAILILPGVFIGLTVAQHVVKHMNPESLKPAVLLLCFISGSTAIFNSF
ncbi:sulfite exporter TauE/SafE family protein [Sansalvadorimonas verongulae]|uniref:sulfite exporter TauE/SafE family protein n=1 Tax=Sansalvadorimonas verongulae TaxID=2172824 RepID=UPI0012BCFEFF|nr:sulfite exporter TauE/SafE family protein [Sansalvadorimonas verongulae]MTI14441.1 sulfite exporter TauE/SafE family protein [Sansalvadorimonas verongulae]